LDALAARFSGQLSTALAVREQHGRDESPFDVPPPSAVVFCASTQDVADAVKLAAAHDVPVIAFGAGSSLEGQLLAVQGGISLDLTRMNRVLDVATDDMLVKVQAGVTRMQLNEELRHTGLFFPIDPGADATLGGMTATRASGTNAVRYGTMRENVLALTVVLADGRVVHTGTLARKSSAGYDLTRLFVGSEGTLGIVTEVTLRLYPQPEAVAAAVCSFPDVAQAVDCTIAIIQAGIPIARVELMDPGAVRAVNAHDHLDLPEQPLLLMEFHGSPAGVREQAESVQAIAVDHGGSDFAWADTPEERTRLWKARHHAYFSALQTRPGCRCVTTDTCVPISRLAESINATIAEAEAAGLPYFVVGHVGDGNYHIGYLLDPAKPEERELAERLNAQLVRRALKLGGTCSGEHGIGLHKQEFLREEAGDDALDVMRAIKQALDPNGILNPGKIFA
ncbi:MAG: FAD-binding protein, partial [Burkholderiales bacterium]|nr:FAD-binding protein [Burkholderiales bacterium]